MRARLLYGAVGSGDPCRKLLGKLISLEHTTENTRSTPLLKVAGTHPISSFWEIRCFSNMNRGFKHLQLAWKKRRILEKCGFIVPDFNKICFFQFSLRYTQLYLARFSAYFLYDAVGIWHMSKVRSDKTESIGTEKSFQCRQFSAFSEDLLCVYGFTKTWKCFIVKQSLLHIIINVIVAFNNYLYI